MPDPLGQSAATPTVGASRCVCPGSFDPVTFGHLDVIRRAAGLFEDVVVAVLHHSDKTGLFAPPERVRLLRSAIADFPGPVSARIRVATFAGQLLVDVCRDLDARVIVRGIRPGDAAYELPMAMMNRQLSGVETLLLPADPQFGHVSSSLIKQVSAYGGNVSEFVPPVVAHALSGGKPHMRVDH